MLKKIGFGISVLSIFGLSSCRSYKGPVTDHFDGDLFYNPWSRYQTTFLDVMKWKFTAKTVEWPQSVKNNPFPVIDPQYQRGDVSVSFINHASFLIQVGGLNILTDPVFSERTSPFSFAGPKRVREPGIAFDALPHIDAVLVSHNHYDHMDLPSLQRISDKYNAKIIVPLGDKGWLENDGVNNVDQMDWWETRELSSDVKIHFAPAQHWSARGITDKNKSLWGSFLIEFKGKMIYIGGDTGYGPHFQMAAERFPTIELALIPIGAYEPRWFMKYAHMNPEDSLKAFRDLKAKKAIGMHFGCWQLTDEGIDEPAIELRKQMNLVKEDAEDLKLRFLIPEVGATYRYQF
jgi:L-ascorbate metabolism protein UlaG (beta-lactamase superfamily)